LALAKAGNLTSLNKLIQTLFLRRVALVQKRAVLPHKEAGEEVEVSLEA
jgi:hypothetical protein